MIEKNLCFLQVNVGHDTFKILLSPQINSNSFKANKKIEFDIDHKDPEKAKQLWNEEVIFKLLIKNLDKDSKNKENRVIA